MSSVRWKDTPRVDFTDGVILAFYHCIEEDNFDCKLASLRFRYEFYRPHFAEMSAVGVASLCRLRLQCNCSILLLPLYIHVFVVAV